MNLNNIFYTVSLSPPPAVMAIGSAFIPAERKESERILVDYEIIFCVSGSGIFSVGNQDFQINPGQCIFIPPGLRHQYNSGPEGNTIFYLHFVPAGEVKVRDREQAAHDFSAMVSGEKAGINSPTIFHDLAMRLSTAIIGSKLEIGTYQRQFIDTFERAKEIFVKRLPYSEVTIKSMVVEILALFGIISMNKYLDNQTLGRKSSKLVVDTISAIHKSFQDNMLEIRAIAVEFRVTPQHLSTLFRKKTGMQPREYLRMTRIEHAKKLLMSTRLSVKEIAAQSGIDDANYFCRMFKASEGVSPNKWREKISSEFKRNLL